MEAEKRIVNFWLNKNGFFTITNINAGKHVIDIIALKYEDGVLERVQHVEVACSISGELPADVYKRNFENREVARKIGEILAQYVSTRIEYEKVLVTNAKISQDRLGDIIIIKFSDVLFDVFRTIDTQNYEDAILRTIQLLKYAALTQEKLSMLSRKMSQKQIRRLLVEGLEQKESIRILSRNEDTIQKIFRKSMYRKDIDKLATLLNENLTPGQRSELVERIAKHPKTKQRVYKEKSLESFY